MTLAPKRSAFSLVEVTLALGIAGFCLIAVLGLLPTGMNSNQTAIQQTAAVGILSGITSDLRATPLTSPMGGQATSLQYGIVIPANPVGANTATTLFFNDDGTFSTSLATQSHYRVKVTFLVNSGARSATIASLKATWPAPVDPSLSNPAGSANMFVALDRN